MLKSRQLLSRNLLNNLTHHSGESRLVSSVTTPKKSYTLVVIGGGSGGIPVAARFSRYFRALKNKGTIAVIEPQNVRNISDIFFAMF